MILVRQGNKNVMAGVHKGVREYVIKLRRGFSVTGAFSVTALLQSVFLLTLPFQPVRMVFFTQKCERECLNHKNL